MAAAIAARHPKWDERPILIVVKQENSTLTEEEAELTLIIRCPLADS